jgi:hypothetical protein
MRYAEIHQHVLAMAGPRGSTGFTEMQLSEMGAVGCPESRWSHSTSTRRTCRPVLATFSIHAAGASRRHSIVVMQATVAGEPSENRAPDQRVRQRRLVRTGAADTKANGSALSRHSVSLQLLVQRRTATAECARRLALVAAGSKMRTLRRRPTSELASGCQLP